ncbi:MAG: MFS transporter [Solirubrobacteraceae bacterium]
MSVTVDVEPLSAAPEKTGRRWWMLATVSIATFMLLLDLTVVNVALPSIQRDLNMSFSCIQWVIDAYSISLASLLLTAGSLADRLGRRRVWTVGLCVFTIASLCCGAAPSSIMLDVARGVQGVGAAVMFAVAPALIAQDFHGRERGNAFAVFGATTGLAIAAGPLLGGVLTELNWRWVFLLNVPLGLVALMITFTRVREFKASHGKPIDWPGLVMMTASMFALIFGITRGESLGWSSPVTLSCLIGSAVLVVLFVAAERRSEHPMLDLSLFRNRTFDGLSFATFCFNFAVGVVVLFAVLWVQDILDTSALQTGIQFLPLTVVLFISGAIGGILSAKWPIRVLMGGALLFAGVGELLMSLAGAHDSWTALLPGWSWRVSGWGFTIRRAPTRRSRSYATTTPGWAQGSTRPSSRAGSRSALPCSAQSRTRTSSATSRPRWRVTACPPPSWRMARAQCPPARSNRWSPASRRRCAPPSTTRPWTRSRVAFTSF